MKRLFSILILVLSVAVVFASCGGGGGGGTPPGGDGGGGGGGGGGTPPGPAISGFDFALATGNFWEFRWDYSYDSWDQGGGGKTVNQTGRYWVVLGPSRQIQGVTAYEVAIYGRTQGYDQAFGPRWKYLAVATNKMLGSTDGSTLTTIFDADKGYWAGGGFFMSFPSNILIEAQSGSISNTYVTDNNAVMVERSSSQSQCEYYPGYGTICGDSSYTYREKEFYKGGLGPLGYYYFNNSTYSGGGWSSGVTWNHNVGLTASSFTGETNPLIKESEPNDTPSAGQTITSASPVIGSVLAGTTEGFDISATVIDDNGNTVTIEPRVEDWYKFTLLAQKAVTITLSFEGSPTADLDLFVGQPSYPFGYIVVSAYSVHDNLVSLQQSETIKATLAAGTYYIGVDADRTPSGAVQYTLAIE